MPVNPLTLGDHQYLVSPRGQTQWVRNLRQQGSDQLTKERTTTACTARELEDELRAIAPGFPVFEI